LVVRVSFFFYIIGLLRSVQWWCTQMGGHSNEDIGPQNSKAGDLGEPCMTWNLKWFVILHKCVLTTLRTVDFTT